MSPFKKNIRSSHLVIGGHLMALMLLVATCDFKGKDAPLSGVVHFSGKEFAGSSTCAGCHESIAETHSHTPHYQTSQIAKAETVKGSFDSGQNVLVLNDRLRILMERSPSGLFQRGFLDSVEVDKKPMDLVIGSGRKGQSYLYWDDKALFQLPVSYYTSDDAWTNSPGYPADQLVFNRNIPARCLECHSTYFKTEKFAAERETFDPDQVMLGVDCERCHGPAGEHVRFHLQNPNERKARNIINPARLTRERRLDNCALCHSGLRENFMPSFSYIVGRDLKDYSYASYPADSGATLDVHGNQYGLLLESKCFKMSESMDCSTCHNVHVKETKQVGLFSSRCMSCHDRGGDNFCKQPARPGLVLSDNCIDCHMPALPSRQVFLGTTGDMNTGQFYVRTHLIGVYEENVKNFLKKIDTQSD
jgi:hypothetical protein